MSGTRGKEGLSEHGEVVSGGVKPISPEEVPGEKMKQLPGLVVETFNALIAEKYKEGLAYFRQEEVVTRLTDKGLSREDIFDKGWLNVEDIYRIAGWSVTYEKSTYGDLKDSHFTFASAKKPGESHSPK